LFHRAGFAVGLLFRGAGFAVGLLFRRTGVFAGLAGAVDRPARFRRLTRPAWLRE